MTPIFSCNKPISTPDYPQKCYRILLRFRIDITIEYQDYSPVSGVRLRKTAITRSQALRSFFFFSKSEYLFKNEGYVFPQSQPKKYTAELVFSSLRYEYIYENESRCYSNAL